MAEPTNNDFLEDIEDMEAEEFADEMEEITDEALELDELKMKMTL